MSAAHQLRYQTTPLEMPNICVKHCTMLNPATLLPTAANRESHDCVATVHKRCTSRVDLVDVPLTNPDLLFCVDGSSFQDPKTGKNFGGFAVSSVSATLVYSILPSHLCTCRFITGQSVVIYTDSCYSYLPPENGTAAVSPAFFF